MILFRSFITFTVIESTMQSRYTYFISIKKGSEIKLPAVNFNYIIRTRKKNATIIITVIGPRVKNVKYGNVLRHFIIILLHLYVLSLDGFRFKLFCEIVILFRTVFFFIKHIGRNVPGITKKTRVFH